jgi:hypothetical protein
MVLLVRNAIFMSVCLNMLVMWCVSLHTCECGPFSSWGMSLVSCFCFEVYVIGEGVIVHTVNGVIFWFFDIGI